MLLIYAMLLIHARHMPFTLFALCHALIFHAIAAALIIVVLLLFSLIIFAIDAAAY